MKPNITYCISIQMLLSGTILFVVGVASLKLMKHHERQKKSGAIKKETRKLNSTCISRIYVNVKDDGQISIEYISAHTGHDLGPQELKYLPLPSSTKQEVSMKISMGITAERILSGTYMTV